jgi:hypothetical protein
MYVVVGWFAPLPVPDDGAFPASRTPVRQQANRTKAVVSICIDTPILRFVIQPRRQDGPVVSVPGSGNFVVVLLGNLTFERSPQLLIHNAE